MHIKKWQLYIAACTLFLGITIAQVFPRQALPVTNIKNATLIETVKELEGEISSLESRLSSLRSELDNLQEQKSGGKDMARNLQMDLQFQQAQAGLTEMTSRGIIITLDDNTQEAQIAKKSDPENYRPNDYIIHDKNLLYLVNELKAAGAEAIAINNQRIVTTTDIRCVGTVIMINSTRVAPPFEITALGDPVKLKNAIENGREYPYLKEKNFPAKIEIADRATVPAYKGSFGTKYLSQADMPENQTSR